MKHIGTGPVAPALALALGAVLIAATAAAGTEKTWSAEVGLEGGNFKYEEFNSRNGDTFMKEEGPQYGIYGTVTVFFLEKIMARLDLSYVGGDLDYEGGVQLDPTADFSWVPPQWGHPANWEYSIPGTGTYPNSTFNLRVTGGYRVPLAVFDVTPYSGVGYRLLKNNLSGPIMLQDPINGEDWRSINSPCSGYQRDQHYTYIPIGLQIGAAALQTWRIEGKAEYDLFLSGKNRSYNLACDDDTTFKQNSGSGYRASVRVVSPPVYGGVSVTVEPFYEHWNIEDSTIVDNSLEPENESDTFGLRVGARF